MAGVDQMSGEHWDEAERLRRLEGENEKVLLRLSELDRALFNLRAALLKGAMSRQTDRGYHQIVISFEDGGEMIEAYRAIYHAIRRREQPDESTT
jgi:hypothetical protein